MLATFRLHSDDHWSKTIYIPKMIVWFGAIIHPRMILLKKQALCHHYLLTISIWCLNNGATFISDDLFDISFVIAAQYTKIQFWKELCFWGLEEENGKSCLIALILPWITINYLDSNCQNFPPRGQMNTKEFSNDFLIKIF